MKPVLTVFLLLNIISYPADHKAVMQMHNDLTIVKTFLAKGSIPDSLQLSPLFNNSSTLEVTEKMKQSLELFSHNLNSGITTDSLFVIISLYSDEFYRIYGEEIYNEIMQKSGRKYILFITTLSCECTIVMCRDYEKALYRHNPPGPKNIAVIDAYSNDTVTEKYGIGFVPALVVTGSDGIETVRFTTDENLEKNINQPGLTQME